MGFSDVRMIDSPTGAMLACRSIEPVGKPRAIVMINHGFAEHSGRYRLFAEALAARSYHVFAHDHRGHGHTKAPDAPLGQFARKDGQAKVIADVMAVHRHATRLHPGLSLILFGHSMGGMIAANTAAAHPGAFSGLAVWNANLNPGLAGKIGLGLIRIERFFKGSDVPSRLGPALTLDAWARKIPNAKTPFDWLSRDPAEVAAYIADPLCGFDASISMWIDVLELALAGGSPARLARLPKTLPVYLAGGGQDPATDNGAAMTWLDSRLEAHGVFLRRLALYPDMRHETLHEIGRETATGSFIDWCDQVTSIFN